MGAGEGRHSDRNDPHFLLLDFICSALSHQAPASLINISGTIQVETSEALALGAEVKVYPKLNDQENILIEY